MAARDAYHSRALAEMSLMTSSLSTSNLRISPIFCISSNIKKWRHVNHTIRKPLASGVWWRHNISHRTSACCPFFVSDQIFKMAARDAYHSKALADMTPMMSSLSESNLRMSPIFRIWLNIQNDGTRRISFERPGRVESDDVITFDIERPDVADLSYLIKYKKWRHVTHIIRKPSPSWVRWRHHFPIFCISLNIQNGGTWRISFESPRRDESEDVITFRIEPPHVADFSYMIKYSKWWHATHIIRKTWPRWARWRHHFRYRTSGCRRFFVSH